MNDDCGLLIFELTARRILHLPITNHQSTINNRQFVVAPEQSGL
jgi:hypothetical protein